ncbi:MAG: hypothetical protein IKO25_08930 [Clostridia bacterium]|nr:hypothetical protein [Clostridia bacterium]
MIVTRERLEKELAYWQEQLEMWDYVWSHLQIGEEDDEGTIAFKIYLRDQSSRNLRAEMKEHGFKYSYDMRITDLITKGEIEDKILEKAGKELFRMNTSRNPYL